MAQSQFDSFMRMCGTCTFLVVLVGSFLYLQKCGSTGAERIVIVDTPTPIAPLPDGGKEVEPCANPTECLTTPEDFVLKDLSYIENAIIADLGAKSVTQQRQARYIVNTHKANQQESRASLAEFGVAVAKGVNSLSQERRLHVPKFVDRDQTIQVIDLDALGLTDEDWDLIVDNADFQFASQTQSGLFISQLTGSDVPWLHGDNLLFAAHGKPAVYNELLNLEATAGDEIAKAGVDFAGDLLNLEASMYGIAKSQIGFNNRMIFRFESDDGFWRQTCDPNPDDQTFSNIFQFPLPFEAEPENAAAASFDCFAFMFIASLPNGLPFYGLYALGATEVVDDDGNAVVINTVTNAIIQEAAPVNLVFDSSPRFRFDAEIENGGLDCAKCHSRGVTGAYVGAENDRVRQTVLQNRDQFAIADQQKILGTGGLFGLYKSSDLRAQEIEEDEQSVLAAYSKLGVDPEKPEPVNVYVEGYRQDYDLRKFCGFVMSMATGYTKLSDCLKLVASGAVTRSELGQLLEGDVVSLETFIDVFPDLVIDFQLGLDPVGVGQ